ncbi:MAG: DUF3313 domain-containing protein [Gammaproteobacteria bacterium]|jgi:hypothetical protein|nr:DUF3313 domain-containing protein [Gammaproteobacteria bacterium]
MKQGNYLHRLIVLGAVLLLAGYGSAGADERQYSGFINDYSGLQETTDPEGDHFLRMVSPSLTPENYHALIIEKVQFYPQPKPSEKVSQSTLDDIVAYLNTELEARLAEKVQVTDKAGPGVARLRIAVTGVGAKAEDLKPYQFIPIALVLTTAKRAATGTPEDAKLYVEAEVTDSVNGERLLVSVRKGTGEKLKKSVEGEQVVTLDTVKPLIDEWLDGVTKEAHTFIKPL